VTPAASNGDGAIKKTSISLSFLLTFLLCTIVCSILPGIEILAISSEFVKGCPAYDRRNGSVSNP